MDKTSNLLALWIEGTEARGETQKLETQKEVWMSLLKGLPTVIVVTVVASITSLIYGGGAGGEIASVASIMAFVGTSVLWALALMFTLRTDEKLVLLRENIDVMKKGEDKLRSEAKEMFLRYKATMMPVQIANPTHVIMNFDDLSISEGVVTKWRGAFTEDRQADMTFLNNDLVREMDELQRLSLSFVGDFNDFIAAIRGPFVSLAMSGIRDNERDDMRRVLAFALFRTQTDPAADQDLNRERYVEEVAKSSLSLAKELHVGSKIFADVAKVAKTEGVAEKARKAKSTHDSMIELFNRMMVEIRYQYSAES